MTTSAAVTALRMRHIWLEGLPDSIAIPALAARQREASVKAIEDATLDDIAFAMRGILERVTDEFNRVTWQPQMEGGKAARELPGIVDQVISMSFFARDGENWRHEPERGDARRLVCRAGNPFGLPAKDRSGRLDITEPPDLGALLTKINATSKG